MNTALIARAGAPTSTKARVALVTRHDGTAFSTSLGRHGHEAVTFGDVASLQQASAQSPFDLVLHDDDLADTIGDCGCPTVPLGPALQASVDSAGRNPEAGGWETVLALAVALAQSNARCRDLERTVDGIHTGNALIGRSAVMRRLAGTIARAADSDATILIEGPQGAGKSLVARMVHCKSRRANRPLLAIDAAATTAETLAKALEDVRESTLIVEDVDRLPTACQSALVRHLKERSSTSAGQPRIVATTSAHLPELVARGAFREDLFYRLHALPIQVPSLRERADDIVLLATAIANAGLVATKVSLTPAAITHLESMSWPGNVAQLESTVRRAVVLAGGGTVDREHVSAPAATSPVTASQGAVGKTSRRQEEREEAPTEESILPFEQEEQRMLARALSATKGNVRRAAQLLGIGRATLYRKIQQYQLRLQ